MKRRLKIILTAVVLLIAILIISYRYYYFVSQTIYAESVSHLSEIFHQSNRSLHDFMEKNWVSLHMWADYLEDVPEEKEIVQYMEHAKEEIGFTDFYFVCREGNYRTIDGESGYLGLENNMAGLLLDGRDTVVNSVVPGKPQIMVFFTPATGSYQDFAYEAVAISFNNSDMISALQISAFDNSVSSYMINADGRVVLDNAVKRQKNIYNFLAMLRKYSDLSSEEIQNF